MLALNDDISHFEKLAMTMKDDTMSIDQKFFGGGVTVKDLIQENSYIIKEMRKMKNVFLNYCKLNDKVYKKIIEHEVSSSEHQNRVASTAASVQRLLSTFTDEMKKLKETTVSEIHKNRQLTEASIDSVKKKLQQKVNEEGFEFRIRKIIDDYEEENASTPNILSDNNNTDVEGPPPAPIPTQGRKKRGLTMEDIQTFKAQLTPLIDAVSVRVDGHQLRICEFDQNFSNMNSKFNKANQEIQWISQDMSQTKKSIQTNKQAAIQNDEKIVKQLRQRTCQSEWDKRFSQFQSAKVQNPIQKLSERFVKANLKIKDQIKEIYPKLQQVEGKTKKNKLNIQKLDSNIKKNEGQIAKLQKKIQTQKEFLLNSIQESKKYHLQVAEEIKKQKKISQEKLFSQINDINSRIGKLSDTIEGEVLKKVEKTVGKQIKQIRTEIVSINKKISEVKSRLRENYEQVSHVQHAISSKANFSDVVQAFDRKADKQDLNDLQQYMRNESPKTNALGLMFKSNSQRNGSKLKKRKTSYSRGATPKCTRVPQEEGSKVFHMEWQTPHQKTQALKNFKESNSNVRHKSLRPSTANTLFLL